MRVCLVSYIRHSKLKTEGIFVFLLLHKQCLTDHSNKYKHYTNNNFELMPHYNDMYL
jgi:hypothetical protein